ncbi:hypothetical protein DS884_17010 [Tenacibaculum sp. E3R01]|uniref:hypothetical protein n=1 Tax=unclassified Tenacibaculum TaxID=2635139 RepID=UPI00089B1FAB|nr:MULTISPECIES: hypothetical protein [unclassified Tenacibaculum]RBW54650.1 hypothetical protein DS884_17010 [Tenacibaculum sp. E3R01]SEE12878.1 hypothetical protein SAMN04487765_1494 [Tenacibaculum sp. MAR_2010_89]
MKKSILNLGKTLNKVEQKTISGGQVFNGPCFEWCADPDIQQMYWKPLYCNCNTGGGNSGGGNGGGDNGGGSGVIV